MESERAGLAARLATASHAPTRAPAPPPPLTLEQRCHSLHLLPRRLVALRLPQLPIQPLSLTQHCMLHLCKHQHVCRRPPRRRQRPHPPQQRAHAAHELSAAPRAAAPPSRHSQLLGGEELHQQAHQRREEGVGGVKAPARAHPLLLQRAARVLGWAGMCVGVGEGVEWEQEPV